MIFHRRDGSRRSVPLRRGSAPAFILLGGLSAAFASDGDLQRILLEHGCVKPRIETVLRQGPLVAYRANCLGTSHKMIDIVCTDHRCSATGYAPFSPGEPQP
ncbi:hypothetical protein ASE66_18600 [Bosea sp. Root483D1]|uniref:hypothetical protein n=1 Tax=Bosea sp. Root483D1 TaxID=1736544 RepID=UPI00070C686B|nr:hypothetical protein [Bosea sp. Root483D1]KRE12538.1 hypothetical protein ASE66_18600 [Bosea sp. Root483D1]